MRPGIDPGSAQAVKQGIGPLPKPVQPPLPGLPPVPENPTPVDEKAKRALKNGLYAAHFTLAEHQRLLQVLERRGGLEDEIAMLRVSILRLFRQMDPVEKQVDGADQPADGSTKAAFNTAALSRATSTLARLLETHHRLSGEESEILRALDQADERVWAELRQRGAGYNTPMPTQFTPTHHALLFAWVAKELQDRIGEERAAATLRQAVRRYGEQRGSRMRQRAQRDGVPADMTAYLAYGEWQAEPGLIDSSRAAIPGGARSHVFGCPWRQAWLDYGVNAAGRLYCLEIDEALGRGFGVSENLSVNGTLSNGASRCEFIYPGADLVRLQEMGTDPSRRVMPWVYHLGHLYATLRSVLQAEQGETGVAALQAGLEQFRMQFGSEAAQQVLEAAEGDFDNVTEK